MERPADIRRMSNPQLLMEYEALRGASQEPPLMGDYTKLRVLARLLNVQNEMRDRGLL